MNVAQWHRFVLLHVSMSCSMRRKLYSFRWLVTFKIKWILNLVLQCIFIKNFKLANENFILLWANDKVTNLMENNNRCPHTKTLPIFYGGRLWKGKAGKRRGRWDKEGESWKNKEERGGGPPATHRTKRGRTNTFTSRWSSVRYLSVSSRPIKQGSTTIY